MFFQPYIVPEKDRTGKTGLHFCAENQNLNCIEQILKAEPSLLNEKDEEGYTPLHLVSKRGYIYRNYNVNVGLNYIVEVDYIFKI